MKPTFPFKRLMLLSIIILLLIACGRDVNLVKSPATTGNIIGKMRHNNGTPAQGVSICLVPANYDPYTGAGKNAIDSTTTDGDGAYSFSVKSPGFFCLSAQSRGTCSYEDSVYGSGNARNTVEDDTLKAPGAISGIAQLRAGHDNRQIIALALGTTTYATPRDSSGAFSLPDLAEGTYRLRILTLNKEYGSIDTTVSVASGQNTAISGVLRLPFDGVPAIGPVVGKFDSQLIYVKLSWPAFDTANVESLYVFRNTGIAGQPYAIINKTDTSFNDDVFVLDPASLKYRDTLRYCIAALGKNRTIGRAGTAPDILMRGVLTPVNTVSLSRLGLQHISTMYDDFTVDRDHNIYISGYGWISKVDSSGHVCANYCNDYSARDSSAVTSFPGNNFLIRNYFPIRTDGKGNVYYYCGRDSQLIKLSTDLRIQLRRKINIGKLMVDSKGPVYGFRRDVSGDSLYHEFWTIMAFDSTLSVVNSAPVDSTGEGCDRFFPAWQILNDTIFFRRACQPNNLKIFKKSVIHFSQIQTLDFSEKIKKYFPFPLENGFAMQDYFAANGMSVILLGGTDAFFFIFDSNDKLLGRCWLGDNRYNQYVFDGIDRIYGFNELAQSIDVYKILR